MTRASAQPRAIIRRNTNSARTTHYVCFHCRKQFKKPSVSEFDKGVSGREHLKYSGIDRDIFDYPCPQCSQRLRMIGKNFRAPKQSDVDGWRIAERLLDAGFSHDYTTHISYPQKLAEVDSFIRCWRSSQGEKLLTKWSTK